MQPKYRCIRCHHVFDEEIFTPDYRLSTEDFKQFAQKYREQIEAIVNKQRQDFFETEYKQFKDCIILCKKCHLLHHEGKDLCPKCKKNFKRLKDEMCWDCFVNSDLCVKYTHPHCKKEFHFRKGSINQFNLDHDTHKDLLCFSECKETKCAYKEELCKDDPYEEDVYGD